MSFRKTCACCRWGLELLFHRRSIADVIIVMCFAFASLTSPKLCFVLRTSHTAMSWRYGVNLFSFYFSTYFMASFLSWLCSFACNVASLSSISSTFIVRRSPSCFATLAFHSFSSCFALFAGAGFICLPFLSFFASCRCGFGFDGYI